MTLSAVFSEVLRMSLTAAAVILCVLPVRLLLRRAPAVWRYALWAVVLFRLLCPVSVPADFAVLPSGLRAGAVIGEWTGEAPSARPVSAAPQTAVTLPEAPSVSADAPAVTAPPIATAPPAADPVSVLSVLWLCGVLSMLTYSVVSLARLRRRLTGAALLRDNIWLCDHIGSPFVLGVLRPRIYLPSVLSDGECDYIILHEQFHIRHFDHIFRLLAFSALCLHWFDPLVWLAFVLAGRDMEMRCDEAVLKTLGADIRADYSQSLLRLATGRRLPVGAPLAFGEGDTKSRIRNVLRWRRPALGVTLCALALCLLVTAACAVDPKEKKHDSPFGVAYATEEVTYNDGVYSMGYFDPAEAPLYRISPEGQLLVCGGKGSTVWNVYGFLEPAELTAENFDRLIDPSDPQNPLGAALREENQTAWRVDINMVDADFYYLLRQKNGDLYITYGYDNANFQRIRWVFKLREEGAAATELYGAYVPNGCLYMNPLSSTLAVGGDDGNRYYIDETGFAIDDRNGSVTVIDPVDWGWQAFPWNAEEWSALFWDGVLPVPDLSQYRELLYQPLSGQYHLVRADGDLWLLDLRENDAMGRYVWSIFRLVPEEATGIAYWAYEPLRNASSPVFRFRFDLPYGELSAFCAEGRLVNGGAEGALLTYQGGEDLCWSPLDENGVPVDSAAISFTLQNGDAPMTGGTLYIDRFNKGTGRDPLYTARIVGAGLTLDRYTDTAYAVVRAN